MTHPKCAEDLLRVHKMFTPPQREQSRWVKVLGTKSTPRRTQNTHRTTARALRPTQSVQRVRFAFTKCAPRHSLGQSDALALKSTPRRTQHTHRTAATALRPTQSAQRVHFAFTKASRSSTRHFAAQAQCFGRLRVLVAVPVGFATQGWSL